MSNGFDAEILQDFLTESGELLEQLEGDLVVLESSPQNPDLLNQIFRALHTIKGSASFLALTNLVQIAHSAESALNAARNEQIIVDQHAMDLLLQSVDILKEQFEQLTNGEPLTKAKQSLIDGLTRLGEGVQDSAPADPQGPTQHADEADTAQPATPRISSNCPDVQPVKLDGAQVDLFEFLVADVHESIKQLRGEFTLVTNPETRAQGCEQMTDSTDALTKSLEFFGYGSMSGLSTLVGRACATVPDLPEDAQAKLLVRIGAILLVMDNQAEGLSSAEVRNWPTDQISEQVESFITGDGVDPSEPGASAETPLALLDILNIHLDALAQSNAPNHTPSAAPTTPPAQPPACPSRAPAMAAPTSGTDTEDSADSNGRAIEAKTGVKSPAAAVEQTIRVDVSRLETLMNLVGELVLQKNRISALARQLGSSLDTETAEIMGTAADSLDRVTGDIQSSVMRTRMQPLDKIFGKYPRLIRDLSRKTGKDIDLVIEGGDTEVDKSVIDKLADPLVHLLRNSADHGIEMPDERESAGKSSVGTIRLKASHEGSYVQVLVSDDGRGLRKEKLVHKALERGLLTHEQADTISDSEAYQLIFHPGFSTAEQVSDLSGRGVGMDVVRSNIARIKGTIDLASAPGKGTQLTIKIPLTIAIMPAMMVAVQHETYAIPLGNILEIVRPTSEQLSTIREHPILRLRDEMLPLFNAEDVFGLSGSDQHPQYAVVLALGERRLGLMVTRPIGQQEIVIKSLDENANTENGSVSGATVRDDGGVSLIVDVAGLFKLASSVVGADHLERKELAAGAA